jgi:hypothetical protein
MRQIFFLILLALLKEPYHTSAIFDGLKDSSAAYGAIRGDFFKSVFYITRGLVYNAAILPTWGNTNAKGF